MLNQRAQLVHSRARSLNESRQKLNARLFHKRAPLEIDGSARLMRLHARPSVILNRVEISTPAVAVPQGGHCLGFPQGGDTAYIPDTGSAVQVTVVRATDSGNVHIAGNYPDTGFRRRSSPLCLIAAVCASKHLATKKFVLPTKCISSGSAPQNPMPEAGGQRTTRAATHAQEVANESPTRTAVPTGAHAAG